ncbi:leucyl aminopeptidase [Roseococcus suduntuyensis]|uniref:Probable cytosol aminopeptidase n=1 Tax=Roseococcus suduntuyensis TaxID=455361 RepID=A0A840AD90_9PROT|nr:leucyl aminopeptidase [Roseococcus suduntuyensis]MBB3898453.1 leucyl aminopeptidase [Roseococcus suduntuyensis]
MLDIAFAKPALPKAGGLVLLLAEEAAPTGLAAQLDAAMEGGLVRALEAAGFKGRKGQSATLWAPAPGIGKLLVLGMGKEGGAAAAEKLGGSAAAAMAGEVTAMIAADGLPAAEAASVAMGAALRHYRFDRYRTTEKAEDKPKLSKLTVATGEGTAAKAAWAPMKAVVEGVFLARDLVSEPPNVLNPVEFAKRCEALSSLGLEVDVLGVKEMRKLGMGALLGVAQGSINEPRLVVMRWNGASKGKKASNPVCFIGKGVTFDTGGISIKPAGGMEDMKWDMAGAGTVAGLMAALAGRKAKVDAVGLLGLVENMPGHNAQRPGDVVTSASGQTIEVINTDAEGRLVLADVIHYAIEKYDPKFMVDLATLTGAIIVALGHEHAGLFANDDELAARIVAAGQATGEACWRMPLGDAYDKQIKSDIADMKNVGGGRAGGSITAAQFIQRFVQKKPWAHLDIAGTAWSSKDAPTTPKGATAFGVRLLDRMVAEHYEG